MLILFSPYDKLGFIILSPLQSRYFFSLKDQQADNYNRLKGSMTKTSLLQAVFLRCKLSATDVSSMFMHQQILINRNFYRCGRFFLIKTAENTFVHTLTTYPSQKAVPTGITYVLSMFNFSTVLLNQDWTSSTHAWRLI